MRGHSHSEDRGIAAVIHDLKTEFLQILNTRLQMLYTELKEKLEIWKTALPLLAGGVTLLSGGFAALTFALIALIEGALAPNPYGWAIGGAVVGFVYLILGSVGLILARKIFRSKNILPERTLKVLKQDQIWLEKEVA